MSAQKIEPTKEIEKVETPKETTIIEDLKKIDELISEMETPEVSAPDSKDVQIAALTSTITDMQAQMKAMMDQFHATMLVKNQEVIETKVDSGAGLEDDRGEIVEIAHNTPTNGFIYQKIPKAEAVKFLFEWFRNKKSKIPDHGLIYDKNIDETKEVNSETCYIRMRKRDLATNRYKTVLHQVPLWIAVDRMLQGHDVELIAKGEYDKHMSEKIELERVFNENYYAKKKLKAFESIANLP